MKKKKRIRNFDLTREKILKETIVRGARYGVDSISTLKIATALSISEGSIFFHFKTKKNLLIETRAYVDENLYDSFYFPDIKSEDPKDGIWKLWNSMVDYFGKNQDELLFIISYRHSRFFYKSEEYCAPNKYSYLFDWMITSDRFKEYKELGSMPLTISFIDSSFELMRLITSKHLEDTPETREYLFKIICSWF